MSVAPDRTVALQDRFFRALPEMAVRWQADTPPDARLLVLNEPLSTQLDLDATWLRSPDGVRFLVGTLLPDGAAPVAQAYAGHQFGGYVPRLGDGRALLLGELSSADGRLRDIHLKGSGPTPFARGGDGWAVVGPMLREYVVSESMHALSIPTTRSLAVVGTGRPVQRETLLPGALLVRVASSHLRVGSFQYAAFTGDLGLLRRLADHAIVRHHPGAADAEHPYLALFEAVVAAQASLIAHWMLVGFVHGVMNTDNMTISGETIDYGPCAFMEAYDPETVFSSIDHWGRYAYGNQPVVAAGTSPASPRRCFRCSPTTPRRPSRAPSRPSGCSAPVTTACGRRACAPSWVCAHPPRWSTSYCRCCRKAASTTRRSSATSPRRPAATPNPRANGSSTVPGSMAGCRGGRPWDRTPS
ncbi:hypothetical protein BZL29_0823 [Mycobacterium kansasii]|uniref:YdiU family protein n=1 Tax=Mycobacterium kansasii TaxID=1768 RepID=A0A1V3XWW7_MYCKA|nr:hypothetical protein BZL29_0823 [Mycobacterium kansasii]